MGDESQYQEKLGFSQKMGFDRPSWKKRFFVLKRNEIAYFSTEKDGKSGRNEKGRFQLDFLSRSKIKAVETGTILVNTNALNAKNTKVTLKNHFLFKLVTVNGKTVIYVLFTFLAKHNKSVMIG